MKKVVDGHSFTIGRIVHYVVGRAEQFPMMITQCRTINGNHYADGVIFGWDGTPTGKFQAGVPYNTMKIDNTWHFPTMWRPQKRKGPKAGQPLVSPERLGALKAASK